MKPVIGAKVGDKEGASGRWMSRTAGLRQQESELGEILIARDKLDRRGLERALRAQQETGRNLVSILSGLGLVAERDIAEGYATLLDIPVAHRHQYPPVAILEAELPSGFLKARRILPVAEDEGRVWIAMADPLDEFAFNSIQVKLGRPVERLVAVPSELEEALARLYGTGRSDIAEIVDGIDSEFEISADDADRLKDLASEAPVIRLVSLLIDEAVEQKASDIHIEPFDNRLRVRYRIDGVMHETASHPSRLRFAVISRLKVMAKLNIAERRLPQDGRIRLSVRGTQVDLRVSTVPTEHGESIVLRILDRSAVVLDYDRLGFDADARDRFRRLLARPNGIVLVTGPTGSGKTTTLYTALSELNAPAIKILTVEDPVEYRLEGINQIAIRPQIGLGFAEVLRSILRQDPDIIMVGEIRDLETAQIAVQAALTGHLVLSTLHTNSAPATVTRLVEMGVDPYLLNSTLTGVVAQRLVRRLCLACRRPHPLAETMMTDFGLSVENGAGSFYTAVGCETCKGTGYDGRLCITEVLEVDDRIKTLVLGDGTEGAIREAAVASGMTTMYQDGLRKAFRGDTTVEEVLRVTRDGG